LDSVFFHSIPGDDEAFGARAEELREDGDEVWGSWIARVVHRTEADEADKADGEGSWSG